MATGINRSANEGGNGIPNQPITPIPTQPSNIPPMFQRNVYNPNLNPNQGYKIKCEDNPSICGDLGLECVNGECQPAIDNTAEGNNETFDATLQPQPCGGDINCVGRGTCVNGWCVPPTDNPNNATRARHKNINNVSPPTTNLTFVAIGVVVVVAIVAIGYWAYNNW